MNVMDAAAGDTEKVKLQKKNNKKKLPQPLKVFHEDVGVRQMEWV